MGDETATTSKYTVLNLKDVDNQGTNFGIDENDYQFRMARVPLELQNSGISYSRMAPGYRQPFGHKHKRQEEIYVVVLEIDYQFRMARVPLELQNSGISYSRMAPGYRQPFGHKHKRQEEIYVVVL